MLTGHSPKRGEPPEARREGVLERGEGGGGSSPGAGGRRGAVRSFPVAIVGGRCGRGGGFMCSHKKGNGTNCS